MNKERLLLDRFPEDEITVEATFDKKYVNPQFSVNNQLEDPDTISEDGLKSKIIYQLYRLFY